MWATTGILATAILMMFIDVPSMRKRNMRRELWVFSLLLITGTGLAIALALHVKIPSPLYLVIAIYKPIYKLVFGFLLKG